MNSDTLQIWRALFTSDSPFSLAGRIALSPITVFVCLIFTLLSVLTKDDL